LSFETTSFFMINILKIYALELQYILQGIPVIFLGEMQISILYNYLGCIR